MCQSFWGCEQIPKHVCVMISASSFRNILHIHTPADGHQKTTVALYSDFPSAMEGGCPAGPPQNMITLYGFINMLSLYFLVFVSVGRFLFAVLIFNNVGTTVVGAGGCGCRSIILQTYFVYNNFTDLLGGPQSSKNQNVSASVDMFFVWVVSYQPGLSRSSSI